MCVHGITCVFRQVMAASKCHNCPRKPASYALAGRRIHLEEEMKSIQKKLSNDSLILFDDFKQVLAPLRALSNHITAVSGRTNPSVLALSLPRL